MPLSKDHKEKTRARILAAAGVLFRERGFDGAGIEEIMAEAGLTRGGFYAHFDSKADLFAKVLGAEPAFTRMLAERQTGARDSTLQGVLDVLSTHLDPDNISYVTATCPMVSLARDVDKGGTEARSAFSKIITDITALLKNGMDGSSPAHLNARALVVFALCVGGVTIARTADNPALAKQVLNACEGEAQRLLSGG